VIHFKSHKTPQLGDKKFLALPDAKVTQGLLVCPTKNVAEWGKNK